MFLREVLGLEGDRRLKEQWSQTLFSTFFYEGEPQPWREALLEETTMEPRAISAQWPGLGHSCFKSLLRASAPCKGAVTMGKDLLDFKRHLVE